MNKLLAQVAPHKTVAIVGLAKNTGKTVTLNYLIAKAQAATLRIGLTSTGRDGETVDTLTALPKPAIAVPVGTVLATAQGSLKQGSASLEILETTGITNTMGEIVLARVRESGTVEVSGPERTNDLKVVISKLEAMSDLVLVDGALDRVAASAPAVTGAAILATGAVIGQDLNLVVGTTVHAARILMTPRVKELPAAATRLIEAGKSGVMNQGGEVRPLPFTTLVDAPAELLDYLDAEQNCLLLGGALTNELAEMLAAISLQVKNLKAIVKDGTRIFVEPAQWQRLLRWGCVVEVLERVNLVAVTVNPMGHRGRQLPGKELVADLQELLPGLLVLNPLAGGE